MLLNPERSKQLDKLVSINTTKALVNIKNPNRDIIGTYYLVNFSNTIVVSSSVRGRIFLVKWIEIKFSVSNAQDVDSYQ